MLCPGCAGMPHKAHLVDGQLDGADRRKRRRTSEHSEQQHSGIERLASFEYSKELQACERPLESDACRHYLPFSRAPQIASALRCTVDTILPLTLQEVIGLAKTLKILLFLAL